MLLVEIETGEISGVGDFGGEAPEGYYYVEGPYSKAGAVVTNISEIEDEISFFVRKRVLISRSNAYKVESDPLYMEWQFDQTAESEQAWRNKVTEIKARYPLIE